MKQLDFSKTKTVIGVTGQIGAGKTSTAQFLSEFLKAELFEADKIGLELCSLEETKEFLIKNFRNEIIKHGEVNRKLLATIVFRDKKRLKKLNSYFDDKIYDYLVSAIKKTPNRFIVIDAAILLQTSWVDLTEIVVVVNAPEKVKIKRASERLRIDKDAVGLRLEHQLSEEELLKFADYLVDNNNTLKELKDSCIVIADKIKNTCEISGEEFE